MNLYRLYYDFSHCLRALFGCCCFGLIFIFCFETAQINTNLRKPHTGMIHLLVRIGYLFVVRGRHTQWRSAYVWEFLKLCPCYTVASIQWIDLHGALCVILGLNRDLPEIKYRNACFLGSVNFSRTIKVHCQPENPSAFSSRDRKTPRMLEKCKKKLFSREVQNPISEIEFWW